MRAPSGFIGLDAASRKGLSRASRATLVMMRWSFLVFVCGSVGCGCPNDRVGAMDTETETGSESSTLTTTGPMLTSTEEGSSEGSSEGETGMPACVDDGDCDDDNACTVDACGDEGEC